MEVIGTQVFYRMQENWIAEHTVMDRLGRISAGRRKIYSLQRRFDGASITARNTPEDSKTCASNYREVPADAKENP